MAEENNQTKSYLVEVEETNDKITRSYTFNPFIKVKLPEIKGFEYDSINQFIVSAYSPGFKQKGGIDILFANQKKLSSVFKFGPMCFEDYEQVLDELCGLERAAKYCFLNDKKLPFKQNPHYEDRLNLEELNDLVIDKINKWY